METNASQTIPDNTIRFSEFHDVRSKCAQTITLSQFTQKLCSNLYKQMVEEYRRLKALPGCEAQAQAIKAHMPCVIPAGVCFGGHAVTDMQQMSRLVCIDLDHTGSRTAEIKSLLRPLPWVIAAFISISGQGVKIFVLVSDADIKKGYASLYTTVGSAISRHVQHPYDEACRTLTQPCFYSWDPETYYNPAATEFVMSQIMPSSFTEKNSPSCCTSSSPVTSAQMPTATDHVIDVIAPDEPLYRFLQCFDKQNPFVRGERNSVCLKLGRQARSNNFSQEDVKRIIAVYAARFAVTDFTEKDIRQRIMSGYQYIVQKENASQPFPGVQQGSRFSNDPSRHEGKGEDPVDVLYKNNELRSTTPCIPDEVYALLPSFLKRCVKHASNPRERDVLLLGSIISCGALFPKVTFFYKDRLYSLHLYLAVVAPAGTGKGVLSFSNSLLDCTDEYYAARRQQLKKEYEEAALAWEQEVSKTRKEHRKADLNLKPEGLHLPYFKISATTSKSRFIESLAASGNIGCIMTSTEIITLVSAIKQDCGAFDDILLKAFHHEEVSSSFKIDGEPLVARHPCLGVCLSGTQEQFASLFRSLETGLFSRFMFYTRARELQWVSCAPGTNGVDLANYFRGLSGELLEMHKVLLESPTYVTFTSRQWEEHTRHFGTLLAKLEAEECEATAGIIFRCGLQSMRMAATFTIFRKWDDYRFAKEYVCTDDDFRAAMMIGDTLLEHSLLLSTSLPDSQQAPVPMHRFYRLDETLAALPSTFSYSDFVNKAKEAGVSLSSAKRMLKNAISMQLIDKEDNVYSKRSVEHIGGVICEP